MRLFGSLWLVLLVACLQVFKAHAQETQLDPTVIWRVTDWPPFYIMEGDKADQGLYNELIDTFIKYMPEFQHVKMEMNTPRALLQIKNGVDDPSKAVCHTSLLFSSLLGTAHQSELNSILLAHVIIANSEVSEEIRSLSDDGGRSVSLEKLIHDSRFDGGLASFGTHEVLLKYQNDHKDLPHITLLTEDYANLVRLFLNKKVDYIVQYSPIVNFFGKPADLGFDIVEIPIAETLEKPYIKVYTGCTKNALGATVIARVNQALHEEKAYLDRVRTRWYQAEELDRIDAFYKEFMDY